MTLYGELALGEQRGGTAYLVAKQGHHAAAIPSLEDAAPRFPARTWRSPISSRGRAVSREPNASSRRYLNSAAWSGDPK